MNHTVACGEFMYEPRDIRDKNVHPAVFPIAYVSLESIEKICRVLNCKVDDIVEFIPDEDLVKK